MTGYSGASVTDFHRLPFRGRIIVPFLDPIDREGIDSLFIEDSLYYRRCSSF